VTDTPRCVKWTLRTGRVVTHQRKPGSANCRLCEQDFIVAKGAARHIGGRSPMGRVRRDEGKETES